MATIHFDCALHVFVISALLPQALIHRSDSEPDLDFEAEQAILAVYISFWLVRYNFESKLHQLEQRLQQRIYVMATGDRESDFELSSENESDMDSDLDFCFTSLAPSVVTYQDPSAYYKALRIDPGCDFRVVRLLQGEFNDTIYCELEILSHLYLDAGLNRESGASTPKYEYEAVSYAWGDKTNLKPVHFRNVTVPLFVTENLDMALRYLRRSISDRYLWIDQLCINQDSVNERNHQISLMMRIFNTASRVLVWLGHSSMWQNSPDCKLKVKKEKYLAMTIQQPGPKWWERLWVIQEVAMAQQDPVFVCGSFELSWSSLLVDSVPAHGRAFRHVRSFRNPEYLQYGLGPGNIANLHDIATIVNMINNAQVTLLHDKVYALLGLMRPAERAHITPDYEKPLHTVFAEATKASILGTQTFRILCLIRPVHERYVLEMPSWAYNFAYTGSVLSLGPHCRKDTLRSIPWENLQSKRGIDCSFDISGTTMTSKGFRLGQIRYKSDWQLDKASVSECASLLGQFNDTSRTAFIELLRAQFPAMPKWARSRTQIVPGHHRHSFEGLSFIEWGQYRKALTYMLEAARRAVNTRKLAIFPKDFHNTPGLFEAWNLMIYSTEELQTRRARFPIWRSDLTFPWDSQSEVLLSWRKYFNSFVNSAFITSESGFFGIGPCENTAEENDWIVLLYGSEYPIILRDLGDNKWQFRGLAYVSGMMGEYPGFDMKVLDLKEEEFRIV